MQQRFNNLLATNLVLANQVVADTNFAWFVGRQRAAGAETPAVVAVLGSVAVLGWCFEPSFMIVRNTACVYAVI